MVFSKKSKPNTILDKRSDLIKLKVSQLADHITCVLCGGYFIDATSIVVCQHTFCKSCIVEYLEANSDCPVCDRKAYDVYLWENLKLDTCMQNLVYKLVPGLVERELKRRQNFLHIAGDSSDSGISDFSHPESSASTKLIEENVTCVSLIYNPDGKDETRNKLKKLSWRNSNESEVPRRFLCCPPEFTVENIKKFLIVKFGLSGVKVRVCHSKKELPSHFTMDDIRFLYSIRPNRTIKLYYTILSVSDNKPLRITYVKEPNKPTTEKSSLQQTLPTQRLPHNLNITQNSQNTATESSSASLLSSSSSSTTLITSVSHLSPIKSENVYIPRFMTTPEVVRSTVEERMRQATIRKQLLPAYDSMEERAGEVSTFANVNPGYAQQQSQGFTYDLNLFAAMLSSCTNGILAGVQDNDALNEKINEKFPSDGAVSSSHSSLKIVQENSNSTYNSNVDITSLSEPVVNVQTTSNAVTAAADDKNDESDVITASTKSEIKDKNDASKYLSQIIIIKKRKVDDSNNMDTPPIKKLSLEKLDLNNNNINTRNTVEDTNPANLIEPQQMFKIKTSKNDDMLDEKIFDDLTVMNTLKKESALELMDQPTENRHLKIEAKF